MRYRVTRVWQDKDGWWLGEVERRGGWPWARWVETTKIYRSRTREDWWLFMVGKEGCPGFIDSLANAAVKTLQDKIDPVWVRQKPLPRARALK